MASTGPAGPSRFVRFLGCNNIDLDTINWKPYVYGGGPVVTGDPYVLTLGPTTGLCGIAPIPPVNASANGEPLAFEAQSGSLGFGEGGDILFTAGGSTFVGSDAGDIRFTCGAASGANGGSFLVIAGTGGSDGGVVDINGGAATGAGSGGNVSLTGGSSNGSNGGTVHLRGGQSGGLAPGGTGGDITLVAGNNETPAVNSGSIKMAPSKNIALPLTDPQSYGGIGIDASLMSDPDAPAHFTAYQTTAPAVNPDEGIIGAGTTGVSSDMAGNVLVFGFNVITPAGGFGSSSARVNFHVPYATAPSVTVTQGFDSAVQTAYGPLLSTPTPFILEVQPGYFTISTFETDFINPCVSNTYFYYSVIGLSFIP
jgi:hypothetical protein